MSQIRARIACLLALSMVVVAGCSDEAARQGGHSIGGSGNEGEVIATGTRGRFTENGVEYEEFESEVTTYHPAEVAFRLSDDVLDPGLVPAFDPALVYPDLVGGWELNLSHAVLSLDTPEVKPDYESQLLTLHATYAAALEAAKYQGYTVIPSVNLIHGKAKQFDDGLYAALDLAYYEGLQDSLRSHLEFLQALYDAVPPDGHAAPFLAAGLSLAGIEVDVLDPGSRDLYLQKFERDLLSSKPIGFYNWTPELQEVYRVLKFFQQPMPLVDPLPPVALEMGEAIASSEELRTDYEAHITFFSQLTNPAATVDVLDIVGVDDIASLAAEQRDRGLQVGVALFPASTSTEQRLFDRLFPQGPPPNADLMQELTSRIMSGEVNLEPGDESGWYDHQCFALETLLLPTEGEESVKLVLSGRYKQRMLDAFAAMITKHRETHVRQLALANSPMAAPPPPLEKISPILRLEPNATYYLRTARAYTFLQVFLHATVGQESLAGLHGLTESGPRDMNLDAELEQQRNLFYGFYLLSMEDVGLPSSLTSDELPDPALARELALDWIAGFASDPDLAIDTRVVVPVAVDVSRNTTNLWATTGVRLAKLDANFAEGFIPSIRAPESEEEWKEVERDIIEPVTYLIPVDEFISVEYLSLDCPTREQFRAMCDAGVTSDGIRDLMRGSQE